MTLSIIIVSPSLTPPLPLPLPHQLEQEHTVQQRMAEATEKARRLWLEEKQHIQREAGRKLKEAVGQVGHQPGLEPG